MKKLLTAVLITCTCVANAQLKPEFMFGIRGGVNMMKVNVEGTKSSEIKFKPGGHIGPVFEFSFLGFGVNTGIFGSTRGYIHETKNAKTSLTLIYAEVPLTVQYMFKPIPMFGMFAELGAYEAYRTIGFAESRYEAIPEEIKESVDIEFDNSFYSRMETGLRLGGGLELAEFIKVGYNYSLGLTDMTEIGSGMKSRMHMVYVSLR